MTFVWFGNHSKHRSRVNAPGDGRSYAAFIVLGDRYDCCYVFQYGNYIIHVLSL